MLMPTNRRLSHKRVSGTRLAQKPYLGRREHRLARRRGGAYPKNITLDSDSQERLGGENRNCSSASRRRNPYFLTITVFSKFEYGDKRSELRNKHAKFG